MANYEVPEELKKMREKEIERLNELDDLKEKVQVGKLVLASYVGYLFGKNFGNVMSYILTGVLGLASACDRLGCDFRDVNVFENHSYRQEKIKPKNIRVFNVSEDYFGVLVEPNGFFLGINKEGNLQCVNTSNEKTPIEFSTTQKKDRNGRVVSLEEKLEIFGKAVVIYEPEKAPRISVSVKRRN